MRTLPSALAALSVLAALAAGARADVLAVDGSGAPGHFATLQAAIDAASPGDTLLVDATLDTSAENVVIDGKALTLLMDEPFAFTVIKSLVVRNIPAGQQLTLCGLKAESPAPAELAMEFTDNAGTLRLYDLGAVGKKGVAQTPTQPARPGSAGAAFTNCADVLLRDCGFRGGEGGDIFGVGQIAASAGGTGAVLTNSKLAAYLTQFTGGRGGDVIPLPDVSPGGAGGTGLVNAGSSLFHYGGSALGGKGGKTFAGIGGPGGTGLVQTGAAAQLDTWNMAQVGGAGGDSTMSTDGAPGSAQQLLGGGTAELAAVATWARDYWSNTPVREGEPVTLTCSGFQDDIWVLLSLGTAHQLKPGYQGALMLGAPFLGGLLYLGTVPFLSVTFPLGAAPELPLGLGTIEVQLQTVMTVGGAGFMLGAPEHIIILDAAY